ncbi:MAG: chemotaxis protein CheW [Planctomycetota bacterium]|nr:chemotaxis protein CheW [Planctomycetota bacterium]
MTHDDATPEHVDPQLPEPEDAAARLLDRLPPEAYLDNWTDTLRDQLKEEDRASRFSAGIVRLGEELFAVPTVNVVEVHPPSIIRSVPGRSGEVFRGLVSLRGEVHLCASLHALFGLDPAEDVEEEERRLLVVRNEGERWALIVDGVLDFERFDPEAVRSSQVTVAKSAVHFTDGVVETPAGPAARIDPRRLFEGLTRSLS